MSEVRKELEEFCADKLNPEDYDDDFGYLYQIVRLVTGAEDDAWDSLSTEAQEWANEAADFINEHGKEDASKLGLPSFPDEEGEGAESSDNISGGDDEEDGDGDDDVGDAEDDGGADEEDAEDEAEPADDEDEDPVADEEDEPEPEPDPKDDDGSPKRARRQRRATVPDYMVIQVMVDQNPKKKGTLAFEKFSLFKDGMTVGAYREAARKAPNLSYAGRKGKGEWANEELRYSERNGHIKLVKPSTATRDKARRKK